MKTNHALLTFIKTLIVLVTGISTDVYSLDLNKWTRIIDNTGAISSKQIDSKEQSYELLFVYAGGCQYCHKFAPVLKQFAQTNQLEIKSISLDSNLLPGFTNAKNAESLASRLNVKTFPTLFLFNKNDDKGYLLSEGYLPIEDLELNFSTLINYINGGLV